MASVERLIFGRDGSVRGAGLKVTSKKGTPTTLQYPLQRLYTLEVSSSDPQALEQSSNEKAEPIGIPCVQDKQTSERSRH